MLNFRRKYASKTLAWAGSCEQNSKAVKGWKLSRKNHQNIQLNFLYGLAISLYLMHKHRYLFREFWEGKNLETHKDSNRDRCTPSEVWCSWQQGRWDGHRNSWYLQLYSSMQDVTCMKMDGSLILQTAYLQSVLFSSWGTTSRCDLYIGAFVPAVFSKAYIQLPANMLPGVLTGYLTNVM